MSDDDDDPVKLDDELARQLARLTVMIDNRPERALKVVQVNGPTASTPVAVEKRYGQLVRWGVPERMAAFMVGIKGPAVQQTQALDQVDEFLEQAHAGSGSNMIVLAGPVGTGKTAGAIRFLERARPALPFGRQWGAEAAPMFLHAIELLTMGLYGEEEKRHEIKMSRALVLDDLGAEYMDGKGVWQCFVDWFVNARSGAAGFTAITTNLPADAFKERFGERTFDRLREVATWFELDGPSMRGHR